MACLIDLSRKLRVRVEALQKELSDSGLGDFAFEENLPDEVAEFLEHQFTTARSKGWLSRLRAFFSRSGRKRSKAPLKSPSTPPEPVPTSARSLPGEQTQAIGQAGEIPSEKQPASTGDDLPILLESLEELLPEIDSGSSTLPMEGTQDQAQAGESLTLPEVSLPEGDFTDHAELPASSRTGSSTERGPGLEPDLLLASLDRIEEIRGDLDMGTAESFPDFPSGLPDEMEPEPQAQIVEEIGIEDLSGFILPEPAEQMSSIRLQALVDDLAKGLPDLNTVPPVERISILRRLQRLLPSIHLDLKQKLALVGTFVVAVGLVAGSLMLRDTNYGPGGDERFFEEGLTHERANRFDAALEAYKKVTSRYPYSHLVPEAHEHMARIHRNNDNLRDALSEMNQGLTSQARILGSATEEWSQADLDYRLRALYFLGEAYAGEKKWSMAADRFQRVLEAAPPEPLRQRALYRLADALYLQENGEDIDSVRLRQLATANETALAASPESEWTNTTLFRLSKIWEELAGYELGIREENLEKSLKYMRELEQRGLAVGKTGIDPLDVKLHIGRLLRELGRADEGIALYREMLNIPEDPLEDRPPPFSVISGLARSLLARAEAGKGASPEADLYEALELVRNRDDAPLSDQDLTEALYLRGHAYYQLGILKPGLSGNGERTFFERMDTAYQAALSRNDHYGIRGEDSLLAMMRRTNYLFQVNQDYRDAVRSYRRILEQFPTSVYAYRVRYRLGSALFQIGEYSEAEQLFRDVVDQFGQTRYVDDKAFRDSYFRLGHCQFLLKDYTRAADTIKTLLRLIDYEETPEALAAWRLLAESYYSKGLYDQAIEEYRNYLARFPNQDPEGKIRLALGRTLISRFDYEEGRRELQRVVETDPQSHSARLARYFICESYLSEYNLAPEAARSGLLTQALDQADRLRKAFPAEDTPLFLLGSVHFLMEDYERAARDLEYFCNAAQGQRPLALAQLLLGESYFNLKNYKRASEKLSAIDLNALPRERAARVLYLLAESYRFDKQFLQAADTYARLAKDFPTSPYSDLVEGRIQEVQWRQKTGI